MNIDPHASRSYSQAIPRYSRRIIGTSWKSSSSSLPSFRLCASMHVSDSWMQSLLLFVTELVREKQSLFAVVSSVIHLLQSSPPPTWSFGHRWTARVQNCHSKPCPSTCPQSLHQYNRHFDHLIRWCCSIRIVKQKNQLLLLYAPIVHQHDTIAVHHSLLSEFGRRKG